MRLLLAIATLTFCSYAMADEKTNTLQSGGSSYICLSVPVLISLSQAYEKLDGEIASLSKKIGKPVRVISIDRQNYHGLQDICAIVTAVQ